MALREGGCFLVRRVADRGIGKSIGGSRACDRVQLATCRSADRGSSKVDPDPWDHKIGRLKKQVNDLEAWLPRETEPDVYVRDRDFGEEEHPYGTCNRVYDSSPLYDEYKDENWYTWFTGGVIGQIEEHETSKIPPGIFDLFYKNNRVLEEAETTKASTMVRDGLMMTEDGEGSLRENMNCNQEFLETQTKIPIFKMKSNISLKIVTNPLKKSFQIEDIYGKKSFVKNIESLGDSFTLSNHLKVHGGFFVHPPSVHEICYKFDDGVSVNTPITLQHATIFKIQIKEINELDSFAKNNEIWREGSMFIFNLARKKESEIQNLPTLSPVKRQSGYESVLGAGHVDIAIGPSQKVMGLFNNMGLNKSKHKVIHESHVFGPNGRVEQYVLRGHWFVCKRRLDWLPFCEDVYEQLEFAYHGKVWRPRTFQPSEQVKHVKLVMNEKQPDVPFDPGGFGPSSRLEDESFSRRGV